MIRKFIIMTFFLVVIAGRGWATTYTVCSSGCDETTIQAVFDNNDLAPDDIVEVRADSPGGTATFRELVTWGANDVGSSGQPVILQGRSGDTAIISGAYLIPPGSSWSQDESWQSIWTAEEQSGDSSWTNQTSVAPNNERHYIKGDHIQYNASKIKIKLKGNETYGSVIDNTAVGPKGDGSGEDLYDYEGNVSGTNVQFSGSDSVSIGVGQIETSDEVNFAMSINTDYLVAISWGGDSSNEPLVYLNDAGTVSWFGGGTSDQTESGDVSGYSGSTYIYTVYEILGLVGTANVWKATVTTEPEIVFFDGNLGIREDQKADLNTQYEWFWASNVLYVYATSDPDTLYTDPGIEAGARANCITMTDIDYITIKNLILTKSNDNNLNVAGDSDYVTVDSSTNSYSADYTVYLSATADHFTLTNGSVIEYAGLSGILWDDGSTDQTLEDSTVRYCGQDIFNDTVNQYSCGLNGRSENTIVRRCTFVDNCQSPTKSHGHEIYFGQDSAGAEVYDCDISGSQTGCGLVTRGSLDAYRNYIHGCTLAGLGVSSNDGDEPTVTVNAWNNVITRNFRGFDHISKGSETVVLNLFNNTIYKNDDTNYGGTNAEIRLQYDCTLNVKNNIVESDGTDLEWLIDNTLTGTPIDYNCTRYANLYYNGASRDWTYWTVTLGYDTNGMNTNPLMVDPDNANFTLSANSPCIDAGTNLGSSYDDGLDPDSSWPSDVTTLDQDLHGNDWEIGAFVYQTIWRWGETTDD